MAPVRRGAPLIVILTLCGCGDSSAPPEAVLRSCMGDHARALAKDQERRPSFDEAMQFAQLCGVAAPGAGRNKKLNDHSQHTAILKVDYDEVKTLACAYSEQWKRCGRAPPTD